jgi:hypothetical protein
LPVERQKRVALMSLKQQELRQHHQRVLVTVQTPDRASMRWVSADLEPEPEQQLEQQLGQQLGQQLARRSRPCCQLQRPVVQQPRPQPRPAAG